MPKKLKKNPPTVPSKPSNAPAIAAPAAVAPAAAPAISNDLSLSAEEDAAMREKYRKFAFAKAALADLVMQHESQKTQIMTQINNASSALVEAIRALAQARGVDPDGKSEDGKPKLTFDLDTFKFHRG